MKKLLLIPLLAAGRGPRRAKALREENAGQEERVIVLGGTGILACALVIGTGKNACATV